MCGIAGIIDHGRQWGKDELGTIVAAMADTLAHRGPDDSGLYLDPAGLFAFGDVVEAITAKMISRHPHVFGDGAAVQDAASQTLAWAAWRRWRGRSDPGRSCSASS